MIAIGTGKAPAPCTAQRLPMFPQWQVRVTAGLILALNKQVEINRQAQRMQTVGNPRAFPGIQFRLLRGAVRLTQRHTVAAFVRS
ncbi:hypothetical protein SAMN05421579_11612 [Xenorhabdus japonica]|uniref:Uncharacterized protein n=1 Tax=Xenorhabdus japonica TaxID=53341 RepID=A0A1I5B6J1_9GAMM|nr:hypothetical protein SAMN05421579_11612 [Xenorhabdus japonica]